MGGRGSLGGKIDNNYMGISGAKALDKTLIRRANSASFILDAGNATDREYTKNIREISNMNLSENDKKTALNKLHELTTKQLQAEGRSVSPYVSGPARFERSKVQNNANDVANKRQEVKSYMKGLKKQSDNIAKQKETQSLTSALRIASSNGKMEVAFNGKTYYKKRKNSTTWYVK